jgi:glutamate carboxypeptidase
MMIQVAIHTVLFNAYLKLQSRDWMLFLCHAAAVLLASGLPAVHAQGLPLSVIQEKAQAHVNPLLQTLQGLVGIESGSRDLQGLAQLANLIAGQLKALDMTVQVIPTKAPDFHPQLKGAELGSMVFARKTGKGQKRILLIAHMDTVYTKGMGVKQSYRIDGNRAYGLGIADDKQGIALILHTVALLKEMGFNDYQELAVLINADEELGSPGSSQFLVKNGGIYDAVMSFEGGGFEKDTVRLATSSIAIVEMKVQGKASHAGSDPAAGRNAIYELAHQILKTRNFGDPTKGLQINWTVVEGGGSRNVIPAAASAIADVRSLSNKDLDLMEFALNEAIKEKLIPDTQVELTFYRSRPAFEATAASLVMAKHAVNIFNEIGKPIDIRERATGGGTDAAFAGLKPKGGVLESFGLRGYGSHSNNDEYILIDSIFPKLYLSTRMVMDLGSAKVGW